MNIHKVQRTSGSRRKHFPYWLPFEFVKVEHKWKSSKIPGRKKPLWNIRWRIDKQNWKRKKKRFFWFVNIIQNKSKNRGLNYDASEWNRITSISFSFIFLWFPFDELQFMSKIVGFKSPILVSRSETKVIKNRQIPM